MPMMLEILPEDDEMRSIASLARRMTSPVCSAVCETDWAFSLAESARRALSTTELASCSMAADVSSMAAACLVVRSARSLVPERISPVAVLRLPEVARSCETMSESLLPTALTSDCSLANAPR